MKLLKYENYKLKRQFIFTLPASKEICGRTCPGCYAIKAQRRFPKTVIPYREARYKASLQDDFVDRIVNELSTTRRDVRTVRIHESGEFYSQEYVDKWYSIAKALPQFTFYTFTKRINDFDFTKLMNLPNFIVINSLQFNRLNYGSLSEAPKKAFICPFTSTGNAICGVTCRYCMTKQAQENGVWFKKH